MPLLAPSESAAAGPGEGCVAPLCSVYAEILIHPIKRNADKAIDEFITAIGADIIAIDRDIARRAAQLRATHSRVRLPDALSLATALATGADLLTFDQRRRKIAGEHRT